VEERIVSATCLIAALVAALFAWSEGPSVALGADGRHRVVIHLTSGDRQVQKGALSNIKHLYHELGEDRVTVELVVHGTGLELFMKNGTKYGEELEHSAACTASVILPAPIP
jgi:hypothetical protein